MGGKHFAAVLLSVCTLAAQNHQTGLAQIPGRMKQFVDDRTVAGIVTLVAQHGRVVEFDAQGMADIEAGHPMQKDTIFQIMSMTKPVTGVAIMMLAEEGKLSLRDTIERHLPEFRGVHVIAGTGPESGRMSTPVHPPTIRDLMTHTSGMFDAAPYEIKDFTHAMNIPLADLVRVYAKQPLLFQPSTRWSYSSPGIDILGRIVEVVSGQKYEDFVEQRILKPLGMKNSFYYPNADRIPRIAMVYEGNSGKLTRASGRILGGDPAKYRQGSVYSAPGWGLYSTAEDLLHFYQMVLNGGVYNGKRYLSKFSVDLMSEVHTGDISPSGWLGGTGYGLTWEVVNSPAGELGGYWIGSFGHGGAFGTQGWIDVKHDVIRIMMIQKASGGTDPLKDAFLTMSAAAVD